MSLHERFIDARGEVLRRLEERRIKKLIDSCQQTASKIAAGHDVITSSLYVSSLVVPVLAEANFEWRFCSVSDLMNGKKKLPEYIFKETKDRLSEKRRISVVRVSHELNIPGKNGSQDYSLITTIQDDIKKTAQRIINAYYGKRKHQLYAADDFEEQIRSLTFVKTRIEQGHLSPHRM